VTIAGFIPALFPKRNNRRPGLRRLWTRARNVAYGFAGICGVTFAVLFMRGFRQGAVFQLAAWGVVGLIYGWLIGLRGKTGRRIDDALITDIRPPVL